MTAPTVESLRARVTEKGPWFDVPADTTPGLCRSCGVMVYFVRTPTGKLMPVDVLVRGGSLPRRAEQVNGHGLEARSGRGVPHFITCPDGALWKAKR